MWFSCSSVWHLQSSSCGSEREQAPRRDTDVRVCVTARRLDHSRVRSPQVRPPAGEQDESRDHRTEVGQLINLVLGGHDPVARASTIALFISTTFSMISSCAFYAIEIDKMSASD